VVVYIFYSVTYMCIYVLKCHHCKSTTTFVIFERRYRRKNRVTVFVQKWQFKIYNTPFLIWKATCVSKQTVLMFIFGILLQVIFFSFYYWLLRQSLGRAIGRLWLYVVANTCSRFSLSKFRNGFRFSDRFMKRLNHKMNIGNTNLI